MKHSNIQNNNQKNFENVFQKYSDVIFRLCLFKTSNTEVAYDIIQEAFVRLWTSISSEKSIDKPKQYLYQITRNLIVDFYKTRKSLSLDMMAENGFDPVSMNASVEVVSDSNILKETIETLDTEFREVIYMKYIEGMKVKEIAEFLDISENLVSVRINRGKKKLKEKFI